MTAIGRKAEAKGLAYKVWCNVENGQTYQFSGPVVSHASEENFILRERADHVLQQRSLDPGDDSSLSSESSGDDASDDAAFTDDDGFHICKSIIAWHRGRGVPSDRPGAGMVRRKQGDWDWLGFNVLIKQL
jgi:hypothetical protein